LTIAASLGLIVTAGAVSLYRSQRDAFARASDATYINETGIASLTLLGQQIQMTGFTPADASSGNAAPTLFGCSGARPTGGDESPNCEVLASHSDGIIVRYVGDSVSTWPSAAGQATDCLGQAVEGSVAGNGASGVLVANRYYANKSGSTDETELYCEGNGRPGYGQPLVEGVEQLRIRYWPAGALQPLDASAITSNQWSKIVAVDLCVLARGAPLGRHIRYVDCDGVASVGSDTRSRQAFWRRVAVRNNEEVSQ
jgi:type IV pilus assembly protein PilW